MKNKFYTILIIIFSILCGIIYKDYFLGTLILVTGLLDSYYASTKKVYNYIFGAIYCLLSGYVSYLNGFYGLAILSFIVYFPSQIHGYISWKKSTNSDEIKVRSFSKKNSIIIIFSCLVISIILGMILSKIPGQNLAFLDSTSNTINLCGIILMNLRFKECWIIFLFNNIIDLFIWINSVLMGGPNSIMMLIVSIGYFLINIYALIKWLKMESGK